MPDQETCTHISFCRTKICTITTSQSIHPWPRRDLKICQSGRKRDLKTCHSWSKRDPKTWWKSRARERARREGSEEGRCCSDGASAGAAASFTVQARPSPVYCRRKKCLPPRHVIVLLGFFLEIFREVLSLLLCLGFFSGGT